MSSTKFLQFQKLNGSQLKMRSAELYKEMTRDANFFSVLADVPVILVWAAYIEIARREKRNEVTMNYRKQQNGDGD